MMAQKLKSDPAADPLGALPKDVRRAWARESGMTINDTIRHLASVAVKPTVEVRLVGFDGTGHKQMRMRGGDLRKYLHALRTDMDTAVLEPTLATLGVKPEFNWLVSHDGTNMASALSRQVRAAVDKHKAAGTLHEAHNMLLPISHLPIDAIIKKDRRDPEAVLTVYVLALDVDPGRYAYSYLPIPPGGDVDEHTPGYCLGTHYVGAAADGAVGRYVWVDLTAGPVTYGPGARQKGQVFEHAMPHPKRYKDEHMVAGLLPQIAATVWSATQHLAWPPVQHLSGVVHLPHLVVVVLHIHETLIPGREVFQASALSEALQAVLGPHQSVQVQEAYLPLSGCPLCVEAFTSAARTYIGRPPSSTVLMSAPARVLDGAAMHRLLTRYQDGIFGHAGVHVDVAHDTRVVPVFLWDVSSKGGIGGGEHGSLSGYDDLPLLFENGQQAMAFPNMVLAVSSKTGLFSSPAICGWSSVLADSRDPTRGVIAGVLQSAWGVANISTAYTPATGPGVNHLWALTNTPWGYLSASTQPSGALATIVPRNLALSYLNESTTELVAVLAGFDRLSKNGKFDSHATGEFKSRVITRVNAALFKVYQAATYMTAGDNWMAVTFAKSLEHDVVALQRLALKVAKSVKGNLQCQSGPTLMTVWWAPCVAVAVWPLAWVLRGKIWRKKLDKLY